MKLIIGGFGIKLGEGGLENFPKINNRGGQGGTITRYTRVVYRALFWTFFIFFLIRIGISIYFVYCNYVNRNKYDLPY